MGFFKKAAESIAADLQSGDPARMEKAARDYVYAIHEGPGTAHQNASFLADAAAENRKKKGK